MSRKRNFIKQKILKKRKINLEKEGNEFIPEVIAYFKKLEISKNLADEVTEDLAQHNIEHQSFLFQTQKSLLMNRWPVFFILE